MGGRDGDGPTTTGPFASTKKWPMTEKVFPRQLYFLMRFFWRPSILPERWELGWILRLSTTTRVPRTSGPKKKLPVGPGS